VEEINDISEDSSILDNLVVESTIKSNKESAEDPPHEHIDLFPMDSVVSTQPITSSSTLYAFMTRSRFFHIGARRRFKKLFRSEFRRAKSSEANEDLIKVNEEKTEEEAIDSVFVIAKIYLFNKHLKMRIVRIGTRL